MKRLGLVVCIAMLASLVFEVGSPWVVRAEAENMVGAFRSAVTWGGSQADYIHSLAIDNAGNRYVVGEFSGTVDFDPGEGAFQATSNGMADVYLSKFDRDGGWMWVKTWGGPGRDVPNGVALDRLGNVYVTGPFQHTVDFNPSASVNESHSSNAGGMNNVFLTQLDTDGNFHWARTWGPADGGAESYSIAVDASNAVYVAGDFTGTTTNFNPWDLQHPDYHTNHPGPLANFDSFLSKFRSDGALSWARTWGGEGYDDGPTVAVDNMGGVYVAGMYASTNINFDPAGGERGLGHPASDTGFMVDVFLSKFDANGNFLWVRTWGGQGAEDAGMVAATDAAGNVYIAGRFACVNCDFDPGPGQDLHSSNGDRDAFLSKFDRDGNFLWARTWGGPGWDSVSSLDIDSYHHVFMTGIFSGSVNFDPCGGLFLSAAGGKDVFFSQFNPYGNLQWVAAWGGSGDDWGMHIAHQKGSNRFDVAGSFASTVDFDPGGGAQQRAAYGDQDSFLSQFEFATLVLPPKVYLPAVVR